MSRRGLRGEALSFGFHKSFGTRYTTKSFPPLSSFSIGGRVYLDMENLHLKNLDIGNLDIWNLDMENLGMKTLDMENLGMENLDMENLGMENLDMENGRRT